jgi:acyl carrier protein
MALREDLLDFVETNLLRGEQTVDPEESLIERGIIDSIGLMQLMTFLEEKAKVRIPDHQVTPENFESIVSMERLVRSLSPES